MAKKTLTIDLNKMLKGYDGLHQKDYQWQMIDCPKNDKHVFEVRIIKHMINSGQRYTEQINHNGQIN